MAKTNVRGNAVKELQDRIGYQFHDQDILEQALTHVSAETNKLRPKPTYERYEFLGDRVLGLLAAEYLMTRWPAATENELNTLHSALTDKHACASAADYIGLAPALKMGGGESQAGMRRHRTILADVMEAVLAAGYLDGGIDSARTIFGRAWADELKKPPPSTAQNNPKLALMQWAHSKGGKEPKYRVISQTGEAHAPTFTVEAWIDGVEGFEPLSSQGRSRQDAEKSAAVAMLKREGVI